MQEVVQEVVSQARNAWRFRWWGALAAWIVALGGWVYVSLQPDVYQARTRILVDTSSVLTPLLGNQIVESDVNARLVQERQKLLGRNNLEQVAVQNNLEASALTETDRDRIYARLASDVQIAAQSASQQAGFDARNAGVIFTITYRNASRRTATGVVNSFKDLLIEGTLSGNREGSQLSASFLERRLAENADLLEVAEDERLDFMRENSDQLPGAGGGIQQRMQNEKDRLEAARRSLRQAQSSRAELERQMNGESRLAPVSNPSAAGDPAPGSLDAQIRESQASYDRLRARFEDTVETVIAAKNRLAELKAERLEQLREHGIEDENVELVSLGLNRTYEDLRLRMTEVEVQIAGLRAEITDRERVIGELQGQMSNVLSIEQELARRDRDVQRYNATRLDLEDALQRQQLSDQASNTDQASFEIIDPPTATTEPVAPNRPVLLAGVFGAAIGGGGALSWLLAQLKPVFSSPRALNAATGLPMFGSVGRFRVSGGRTARRRLSLLAFLGAMFCLLVVYGAGAWFELSAGGVRNMWGVG